jgi:phosphoenolpyruvate carboxykinase (ATP)
MSTVDHEINRAPRHGLEHHGFRNMGRVYWSLSTPALYESIVRRGEGMVAHLGPIVVRTGDHTGRSPDDKFIVHEASSADHIWWGKVNRPFDEARFDQLYHRLLAYVQGKDIFVQDCAVCAHPDYRVPLRIITEDAWQSLFARNMFIQIKDAKQLEEHVPQFRVLCFPRFHAIPEFDGTNSETFIIVNFEQRTVIIGGTSYGGEIKKSVFTILNYLLPRTQVLSMHCSANVGAGGDVALFFGLSGTGKTSLSADPERVLIGDDEHGWSDEGIFNFEGGCYAKVIRLSPESEPEIYECTRRFGTVLENVAVDTTSRRLDLNDDTLTENTRACYPLTHLRHVLREGCAGHPKNVVLLTCDAFGVLPPVAALTPEQAMYQFLSGYTAKVAGTERGVTEPEATFSACFGAPFMALPPTFYTNLFGERVRQHHVRCWLVNTGWIGGPYGVGRRIDIASTRAIIRAALSGELDRAPVRDDPNFGLHVPAACPGIDPKLLDPRSTWSDPSAYDQAAQRLVAAFRNNMKQFEGAVPQEILAGGPPG